MKKAIIDIGSNSVRLCVFANGIVIFRDKITSQLAEGLSDDLYLSKQSIERTVQALKELVEKALALGVEREEIFAFATAAVRNSVNGKEFCDLAKSVVNQPIDVLSGDLEGEMALLGVFSGGDGVCLDIGGGSTELVVAKDRKILYSHSIKIGAVVLYDKCGEDRDALQKLINEKLSEYKDIKIEALTAIGGTCSIIAMLQRNLKKYDREIVNNTYIALSDLELIVERLFTLSKEQRVEILGIKEKRAKIICGGALILLSILKKFNLSGVTVSENDNLEGYYRYLEGMRYEK